MTEIGYKIKTPTVGISALIPQCLISKMWLRLLVDELGLVPAASALPHQPTSPQVFVSGAPHYLQRYLIILSPARRSDSRYGWRLHYSIPSTPPPKKNPIFIQPALLFFAPSIPSFSTSCPFSLHRFPFSFLVFSHTTIVPCYESVVSAAKPPGDAAAAAVAAKKQRIKRSRAIRIATIVKNIGPKERDKNKMLTSTEQVLNKYQDCGLFGYQAETIPQVLSKSDKCFNFKGIHWIHNTTMSWFLTRKVAHLSHVTKWEKKAKTSLNKVSLKRGKAPVRRQK